MERVYAFIDESGAFGWDLQNPSVSKYFILTAVIVEESKLKNVLKEADKIRQDFFQAGEMKSNKISKNHDRRVKLLSEISKLDCKFFPFVCDKAKLANENFKGLQFKQSFYKFLNNIIDTELTKAYSDNVNIPMGKTPSGVYDPETKIVTKQNTIGDYGCLFTSAINVANDIKLRYCEKGAIGMPKNMIIPATSISAKANSDKYFTYQNNPNKHESDANMTINNIKQLIEDVSTRSVVIEEITGTSNIEKAIAELNNSSTDNGYIIAHCNGHFFNLTGIDSNPNKEKNLGYLYHDPYIRKTIKSIDNFRTKVNNGGIDKIFIIRIEE